MPHNYPFLRVTQTRKKKGASVERSSGRPRLGWEIAGSHCQAIFFSLTLSPWSYYRDVPVFPLVPDRFWSYKVRAALQWASSKSEASSGALERRGETEQRDTGLLWSRTTDKQQKKAPPEVTDDAIYRRPAGAIGGRGSVFFFPWGLWGLCQSNTEVLSFFPLFCIELLILDLSVGFS